MKLSRLAKINEGFVLLTKIDKEVMEIEKLASEIVTNRVSLDLELKCINHDKKVSSQVLDANGDLISETSSSSGWTFYSFKAEEPKPKENESVYKESMGDTLALQVLGLLLRDKQDKRNIILNQFKQWGVEI